MEGPATCHAVFVEGPATCHERRRARHAPTCWGFGTVERAAYAALSERLGPLSGVSYSGVTREVGRRLGGFDIDLLRAATADIRTSPPTSIRTRIDCVGRATTPARDALLIHLTSFAQGGRQPIERCR